MSISWQADIIFHNSSHAGLYLCGTPQSDLSVKILYYDSSVPSGQKLEFSAGWYTSMQGKVSTAVWFHRLEILTKQLRESGYKL